MLETAKPAASPTLTCPPWSMFRRLRKQRSGPRNMERTRKHMPDGKLKAPGSMAESAERRNGFPLRRFDEWAAGGFKESDCGQFDYELRFTPGAWRGKVRSISWFSQLDEEGRRRVDREIAALFHGGSELTIPHRCSFVLHQRGERPPASL